MEFLGIVESDVGVSISILDCRRQGPADPKCVLCEGVGASRRPCASDAEKRASLDLGLMDEFLW